MSRQQRQSVTPRPWLLRKRVLPQHTDHAGVMWHGAYVAWLEEARVEALSAAGLSYSVMSGEGVEMPVVSLRIDYRQALKHGDEVVLESYCEARRGVRWPWTTRFLLGHAGLVVGLEPVSWCRSSAFVRPAGCCQRPWDRT